MRIATLRRRAAMVFAAAIACGVCLPGAAQPPFVMGTIQPASSFAGLWLDRIYGEAFRRLQVPLEIVVYPTARLSVELDAGAIDGDMARVFAYGAAHPALVRVEEPSMQVVLALYTASPELTLRRLEDLPATSLHGTYMRGVAVCENLLKPLMSADRLSDVTTDNQALRMLLAGRTDFHCTSDLGVASALASADFGGVEGIRQLLVLGDAVPFYTYLHRKHAELAPRLAAVLKQMKAEGLIERYRREAERETRQRRP